MRDDPERVRQALSTRNADPSLLDTWLKLDAERRSALVEVEELKRRRNEASREIGKIKQQKGDASEAMAAVGRMKARIEEIEARLAVIDPELSDLELRIPKLRSGSFFPSLLEPRRRIDRACGPS